ncbi:MAG: type II toxin-antitoxin system RelE/ParE family toxin [Candidatus Eremiobacteraeota bacterium]|nr:type II toxin-antitoxin system RelE/ParE family toxin [Candidatus Eremiobacteraeota bacterium]
MPNFALTAFAIADLDAIYSYVATDGQARADALIERIFRKIELLERMPRLGRLRPEFAPDMRSFPAQPFIVFYRVIDADESVEIVRVIDGRRDLGTVFLEGR